MAKLYGDGIHDDIDAIQEQLDSGISLVYLPKPQKCYVISREIKIHSNQTLKLDPDTRIVFTDMANTHMLGNADWDNGNKNITIDGGIWDMNHRNQWPNPYHFPDSNGVIRNAEWIAKNLKWKPMDGVPKPCYTGHCFRFHNIDVFTFKNITIVNPVVYGAQMSYVTNFTIENITFDYTEGSPKLWNLDGIHLEGGCCHGKLRNLCGACHDDLLAITTNDGIWGPIEDIDVDGIYAQHCHSAIRFLSRVTPIKGVHARNISGTFYVYCLIFSRYNNVEGETGRFEDILIENIDASISEGTVDVPGNYEPLIHFYDGIHCKNVILKNIKREETRTYLPTIKCDANSLFENFVIDGLSQCTISGGNVVTNIDMPALVFESRGEGVTLRNVCGDCKIVGEISGLVRE